MTLGQFLLVMAAVELVVLPFIGWARLQSAPNGPAIRRRSAYILIYAGVASALGLALLAYILPEADIVLF